MRFISTDLGGETPVHKLPVTSKATSVSVYHTNLAIWKSSGDNNEHVFSEMTNSVNINKPDGIKNYP